MENQEFIKLLEDLKNGGFIYNDADFCKKKPPPTTADGGQTIDKKNVCFSMWFQP